MLCPAEEPQEQLSRIGVSRRGAEDRLQPEVASLALLRDLRRILLVYVSEQPRLLKQDAYHRRLVDVVRGDYVLALEPVRVHGRPVTFQHPELSEGREHVGYEPPEVRHLPECGGLEGPELGLDERKGRDDRSVKGRRLGDAVFAVRDDHCEVAHRDVVRRHAPLAQHLDSSRRDLVVLHLSPFQLDRRRTASIR